MRKIGKFMLASVALVAVVGMPSALRADHGNKGSSHHGSSSHYSPGGGFGQVWSSHSYPSSSNCSSSRYPSGPYYPTGSSCSQYPQPYPQYPQYPQPYPQYPQGSPSYPQSPMPYPPQFPQYPSQPMPPSYPTGQQLPPSGPWGQPTGASNAGGPWGQPSGTWGGYGGQGPVITAARP